MNKELMSNKYSKYKIVWFPDKLKSLRENKITAPIYIRVKFFNQCNNNCFFCAYRKDVSGMHKNMKYIDCMPRKKMIQFLSDCNKMGVKAITFSGGGEPLIYPYIEEALKLTNSYGIDSSIITNGLALEGNKAKLLKDAKWVRVSVDYYTAAGYAKSRRIKKDNFYKVVKNIYDFDKIRTGDLELNYIVHKDNYKDIYKSVKFWKSIGVDNIRFCPAWFPNFFEYHKDIYPVFKKQYKKALKLQTKKFTIGESFTKEFEGGGNINRMYKKCNMMQILPVVGADCNVYACHNKAYDKTGIIGSIKNQSFKKMWFSKKTHKFFNSFNPCKLCKHQCTNDAKNILINDILDSNDNFI